jgi:hypothetical protein
MTPEEENTPRQLTKTDRFSAAKRSMAEGLMQTVTAGLEQYLRDFSALMFGLFSSH